MVDQVLQGPVLRNLDNRRLSAADGTFGSLLVLKGVGVYRVITGVLKVSDQLYWETHHHVVVQERRTRSSDLEGLVAAGRYESAPFTVEDPPATIAFVLAIAGITFFTTPWVRAQVTPSILNSAALAEAI